MTKLALGTVQFGAVYGINNTKGRIPEREVTGILNRAYSVGIDMLDTAQVYGDSEAVLGRALSLDTRFKIVSKFIAGPGLNPKGVYSDSRARLNVGGLYAFLYHKFSDFRDYPGWYDGLRQLKAGGALKKIGFSVYYPHEVRSLLDRGVKFDLVQLPYSVFDRRFESLFPALRMAGVEVHVRSVFLQGLAFMKPSELPPGLAGMKGKLEYLNAISQKTGIPVSALCLCFGLLNPDIDRVIVGVDGPADLEENLAAAVRQDEVKKAYEQLCLLKEDNEELILPFKWKK